MGIIYNRLTCNTFGEGEICCFQVSIHQSFILNNVKEEL